MRADRSCSVPLRLREPQEAISSRLGILNNRWKRIHAIPFREVEDRIGWPRKPEVGSIRLADQSEMRLVL